MKRFFRFFIAVSLLALLPACAGRGPAVEGAAASARSPLADLKFEPLEFDVPEVERMELPNGIRLYLREDHELPLVSVTAMLGAGAIGVPAEKTGMGGLFAALLRTGGGGGRTPAEVDEALEKMAANLGVSNETYTTEYALSVQSEDLEEGMAIFADLIRRPAFDPERLEIARRQAIEGIRRQYDEPDAIAARAVRKAIYGEHPLGRSPQEGTVNAVGRDDLVSFHRRYFHPNNLWIAVSGDFDRQKLTALLERYFGDWKKGAFTPQEIPPLAPPEGPLVLVAPKEIPQTTILIGELGIDKDDPDLHPTRVMNYILGGGGFNSRLMREIRSDRGLAYSVYSYFQIGRRLPGPFLAGTETKSASTLEAVRLMREIIAAMQKEPVGKGELALAKESIVNSFLFAFTDPHEIVTQKMLLDFFDYPPDYLETYREKVGAVTAEDVHRAASRHLSPGGQKIVLVGDVKSFDGEPAALGAPVKQVEKTGEFR